MRRSPVAVRLPLEVEESLIFCAKELNKSKSQLISDALINYLEDIQDYISAKKILARNEPTISQAEMERQLGL